MLNQGSCLSFPIEADARGTFKTISDIREIVKQSIIAIIETRQGERVMVPDYGIPDFVFSVMDSGFAARLAYFVAQQIGRYEPLATRVSVVGGTQQGGTFIPNTMAAAQQACIQITYQIAGTAGQQNLVYPVWQLAAGN
jgi:phage baseplate assembly protein W